MTSAVPPNSDVRYARGSSGQHPDEGLARDLSELARDLQAEQSMEALVQRITHAAVVEIEHAEFAGISEINGRDIVTRAATDDLVTDIDRIQYESGDGPCLTSLREQVTVRSDDLASDRRWAGFSTAAAARGARSMLSVQLFADKDNLGALNLYAAGADAFDDRDESNAMLLAAHAAVAMKGSSVEDNLRVALESRDVIGQAKGILMERYKVGPAQAFDLLVLASQSGHRKLRDIADELAATGELRGA